MNSLWLIIGALAAFAVAYRYYSAFLAAKVAMLDDSRPTPAHRLKDGVDYYPTKRLVLFGHHFAAIAGPGPLVGPVLASQWGFFPGFVWIVVGACLAGAVHDFVILWASVREDGLSLPKIARRHLGPVSGLTASVATLFIIICTLASVGVVVVNALGESSWGVFTIIVTIPAALLTGFWMNKLRPGKVAEASVVGVTIVLAGVFLGRPFAESSWGHLLLFSNKQLSVMLAVYACIASILPVWLLLVPRDYLSSYMKIGVMVVLAAGMFLAHPALKMPATTPFLGGGGPVISGAVWPFVCIVIMCGALSGFHSLIASGTTPKMVNKESDIRVLGYGAMVIEGFVSILALVAACALAPGDYFAINVAPAKQPALIQQAAAQYHWDLTPKNLTELENGTKERLVGRVGGAVTLAAGMADIFSKLPGMKTMMSYWYHFVIMFEALFILTLLETGTRVARFVFQEVAASFTPKAAIGGTPHWGMNISMSLLTCFCWGYLLYTGNINTLWRMFGISNQLLASIALAVGTTYLLLHAPKRVHALCTGIPFVFVIVTVLTAGCQSVAGWWNIEIPGLLAQLNRPGLTATAADTLRQQVFNLRLTSTLTSIMLVLTVVIVVGAVRSWFAILGQPVPVTPPAPVTETA